MKRNKGITLIALVITIIVLLILAGVAISMLSGENGILKKAAEAKTKTEESQKEESTALLDMEIDSYFITNNLKYKCRNGYITGIQPGTTVERFKQELPSGYLLKAIDGTDTFTAKNNNGELIVTTGLIILNNEGEEVARTVIFGDITCSGMIEAQDTSEIGKFLINKGNYADYQIAAMDVNHDGSIDKTRANIDTEINQLTEELDQETDKEKANELLKKIEKLEDEKIKSDREMVAASVIEILEIDQYKYATNPKNMKYRTSKEVVDNYIKNIPESFKSAGYNIIVNPDDTTKYVIQGVTRGSTKVGDLKTVLPENTKITYNSTELSEDEVIGEDSKKAKYRLCTYDYIFGDVEIATFE